MGPGDPRGRVRGRGPRGLHRAAELGSGGCPPALPPARRARCRRRRAAPSLLPPACLRAACARRSVCECVCVRGRVYVCVSACVSAPGAPPAPPACCRKPRPPPLRLLLPTAGRPPHCSPRPPLPGAAPRALPRPRAPPSPSPALETRGPPAGFLEPASPAALRDPLRQCAPAGNCFEPARIAEPATSSEVPFDSAPRGA